MKWLAIIPLLFLFSCKKAEDRRCWKGAGEDVTVERTVDDFTDLYVGPHVSVRLVQDGQSKVEITGGKNLVNFITTEVVDGQLRIENTNRCNFLRSYKHEIEVVVHLGALPLKEVYFEGTRPFTCDENLVLSNLSVIIRDGAGKMNFDVACNDLTIVVTNGWGNFELKGTANKLHLDIRNNGFGDAYQLNVAQEVNVVSNTSGVVKVDADVPVFNVQTSSSGDVWYVGNPGTLNYTNYGTGELIDKN